MVAAFMSLELKAGRLIAGVRQHAAAAKADFHHSGTVRTRSYGVDASFML